MGNVPKISSELHPRRPNAAKKNAITGLGHFLSWLMEFLLFGICQVLVMAHR